MAKDGVHSDEANTQVKVENDATMIPSRKRAPESNGEEVAEHGGDGHVPSTGSVLGNFEVVHMPGSSSGPPLAVVNQQLSREAAELVEYATSIQLARSIGTASPASESGAQASTAIDQMLPGAGPSSAGSGSLASVTLEAIRVHRGPVAQVQSSPPKSKSPRLEGETTPTRERVRSGFAGGVMEEQYRLMYEQCNMRYRGATGVPVQCSELPQFYFGFTGHLQGCPQVGIVFCCDHADAVLNACLPNIPEEWAF